MYGLVVFVSFINLCFGLTNQMPYFNGQVEKIGPNKYLGVYGTKFECRFKHEPVRMFTMENGTNKVEVDTGNMTNSIQIRQLVLRLYEENSFTIAETELNSKANKFLMPLSIGPAIAYAVEGSIPINSLELMKSHVYSCCLENRLNESESLCSYLQFKRPKNHDQSFEAGVDFLSRNIILYRVIIILLVGIFILLVFMFVMCLRFSIQDDPNATSRRRHCQQRIRSISSPEMVTVSVPGQASIVTKMRRDDLYARYNLNTSVVSVIENECAPPPPYAESVATPDSVYKPTQ